MDETERHGRGSRKRDRSDIGRVFCLPILPIADPSRFLRSARGQVTGECAQDQDDELAKVAELLTAILRFEALFKAPKAVESRSRRFCGNTPVLPKRATPVSPSRQTSVTPSAATGNHGHCVFTPIDSSYCHHDNSCPTRSSQPSKLRRKIHLLVLADSPNRDMPVPIVITGHLELIVVERPQFN